MSEIILDPYIPLGLWAPLAVAAAALLAWYAATSRRRLGLGRWSTMVLLMGISLATPLGILLNPTWLERIPPPAGKPLLTVLIDRSASMEQADGEEGATRYETAGRAAREIVRRLADRYDVRLRWFADDSAGARPEDLDQREPDGAATDLAAAIEKGLHEDCLQGQAMLLLSDGGHNAGGGADRVRKSAAKAKAMAAPILACTLGGQAGVRDLEVSLDMPEKLAFVGQDVPVIVHLRQRGALARRTTLSLRRAGQALQEREVELSPDGVTEEVFQVTEPAPGLYRYEIVAEPLAEEVTGVNNTATLLVRAVDEPVRVLLLEGKPYWDTKFLVRKLAADDLIDLVSVVRLADERFLQRKISPVSRGEDEDNARQGADEEGPESKSIRTDHWEVRREAGNILADPDMLASFQIVVLGRDTEVFLTDKALVQLETWLNEQEGSLVCFRGAPSSQLSSRLGALMPVHWKPSQESRFRVRWTESGRSLRWLHSPGDDDRVLPGLPSLATVSRPEKPRPLAVVLATTVSGDTGDETPAISYQRVGSGRVVAIEGAGMWRWAFLPAEHDEHDELYGRLWQSMIRWLVTNVGMLPSERLALSVDKVTFTTSESVTAELLLRREESPQTPPRVELTGDGLEDARLITPVSTNYPGQYRVPFGKLPEGRYWARVEGAGEEEVSAVSGFDVRGNLRERLEVQARPDLMERIADESGGGVLETPDTQTIAERFEQHLVRVRPERIRRTMAWDRWWVLVAALTFCATAWGFRRRWGLI